MKAALVALVLVPALGAVQGGYNPDAWVWSGALAAWAAALAIILARDPGAVRNAWPWLAGVAALLAWTALSTVWSARPSQSLLDARRTIVYAAVVLALVLLVRRSGTRVLVLATHAALTGLLLYALLHYLLAHRRSDPFEAFLLSSPVGYANGVGILAALGIVLGVGIAASGERRAVRAAAAATVPLLVLALELTSSTGSWLALAAGLAVAALLDPSPLRLLATIAPTAPPAALAAWLGSYSNYTEAVPEPRLTGWALVLAAAGCAAVAAAVVGLAPRPREAARAHRVVTIAVLCLAVAGGLAIARAGSTQPRESYWSVAWHEYRGHPALGSGAGTFGYYWARSGKPVELGGALDAHSLYIETLAELGPLGLVLLAAFLAAPFRALRARTGPLVAVAFGAYAAFLVHAALDWDWEQPVVVVAALSCAAAAIAADIRDERPLGRSSRAVLLVIALVLAGCAIAGSRSSTVPSAAGLYFPWPFPWP
jgi:O-antigen ligase